MRPLFYLTGRTIVNSFRRAVQSPTRILGVLMIIGWWFMVIGNGFRGNRPMTNGSGRMFDLPPENAIFAIMFAAFLVLFFLRSFVLFSPPGVYRQADADVLFATPVKPWHVLMHRFIFDYAVSLLLPILLLVFSGRRGIQGIENIIRNLPDPSAAQYFGRTSLLAFLLLSLFLAALAYAVGMAINRDSPFGKIARRIAMWTVIGLILTIFAGVALAISKGDALASLVEMASSTTFRLVFYPIAAAADMSVAPLYGHLGSIIAPASFLLLSSGALLWAAMRQTPNLFDMAARQAANTQVARDARRRGDQTWMVLKAAREGKLRPRRLRLLENLAPTGRWAIVWREAILTVRMNVFMFGLFFIMSLGVTSLMLFDKDSDILIAIVLVQFIMQLSVAMGFGQSGFIETLRRLDVQKPLPFSPLTQCVMECIGKSMAPMLISFLSGIAICLMVPGEWAVGLSMAFGFPTTIVVVVATQLLVLLLFPDVEDPTQAAFRGLMQFLGAAIASLPGLITVLGLSAVLPIPAAALVGCFVNIAVIAVLLTLAAPIYAAYNSSE